MKRHQTPFTFDPNTQQVRPLTDAERSQVLNNLYCATLADEITANSPTIHGNRATKARRARNRRKIRLLKMAIR